MNGEQESHGSIQLNSARLNMPTDTEHEGRPAKRRRVLACDTCRRLKNRCEYDSSLGKCTRCKRLRLECSLASSGNSDTLDPVPNDVSTIVNTSSIEEKLNEHGTLLNDIKDIVQQIHTNQSNRRRSHSSFSEDRNNDYGQMNSAADINTTSAPVNLIRNRFSTHSGLARLSRQTKDVVELGLLSERQTLRFQELFFQRVGPWVGIDNWNSISETRDVRRISPLLFAAACLQGGRLDPAFCNTPQHEALYEHVRNLTGHELLISPLPIESVCALLIVAIWSTSPKEKAEFIDSWLLSGYAIQQAKLSINFTTLMKNLNEGRSAPGDARKLRLWNMVCNTHLQFGVGTGRPSVIANEYLEHCSSMLKSAEATLYDEITVASVTLFSTVQELLRHHNLTEEHSRKQIRNWTNRWGHVLEANDSRICVLQMAIDFCHLVLDKRCLEHLSHHSNRLSDRLTMSPNDQQNEASPASSRDRSSIHSTSLRERYILLCREHAFQVLFTFRNLPMAKTEELPEFLYLCVIYAMIVLVEIYKERPMGNRDDEIPVVIRETLTYGLKAVSGVTISFELIGAALDDFLGTTETRQPDDQSVHQPHIDATQQDLWPLPQLEDIFSGAYTDNFAWYQ